VRSERAFDAGPLVGGMQMVKVAGVAGKAAASMQFFVQTFWNSYPSLSCHPTLAVLNHDDSLLRFGIACFRKPCEL